MTDLLDAFCRAPIAHRALHDLGQGRPENSRVAVRAAVDAGYGIEVDLQLSRDGVAMVFHDYDLGRLTGERGPVQQRDAADLGQIRLSGGDEGIPTLAEVLAQVGGRVPMLIELKDQHGQMGETCGRLEAAVAADLARYDGPAAVMSFNPHMVARLADLAPDVPRGIVSSAFRPRNWMLLREETRARLRGIPDYARTGSTFISHEVHDLDRPRVAELKAQGAKVFCWTVRTIEEELSARHVADNITFEGYPAAIPMPVS